jgi:hypothetical protein
LEKGDRLDIVKSSDSSREIRVCVTGRVPRKSTSFENTNCPDKSKHENFSTFVQVYVNGMEHSNRGDPPARRVPGKSTSFENTNLSEKSKRAPNGEWGATADERPPSSQLESLPASERLKSAEDKKSILSGAPEKQKEKEGNISAVKKSCE